MRRRVIIFSYLQRHLRKLVPVIKALWQDKRLSVQVIVMTNEEINIAISEGISARMLDEFADKPKKSDFDLGWGLEPLINAIKQIKPDLFIAIEVNYILRNAIRYCSLTGIPNLVIQHGTPNEYSLHAFLPFEGDCFAAWGEHTSEFLQKHGMPLEKVYLTGGAHFDRSLSLITDKDRIAAELNLRANSKWLLFTTQGSGAGGMPTIEEIEMGITEVASAAMQYPDVDLIYQVHPGQSLEDVQRQLEKVPEHRSRVVKYRDTEALIAASDFMITFFSTTALDAIVMKKPLLLINLSDDSDFLPFVGMGAAYGAYTKEEIRISMSKLIEDPCSLSPNVEKAAEYVNYRNDGKALHRIINLIMERLDLPGNEDIFHA